MIVPKSAWDFCWEVTIGGWWCGGSSTSNVLGGWISMDFRWVVAYVTRVGLDRFSIGSLIQKQGFVGLGSDLKLDCFSWLSSLQGPSWEHCTTNELQLVRLIIFLWHLLGHKLFSSILHVYFFHHSQHILAGRVNMFRFPKIQRNCP